MLLRSSRSATALARRCFASAATYQVTDAQKLSFREKGYAVLPNFLSDAEIAPIEKIYDMFMRGEVPIPGKDFCDMSQTFEAIKGKHPDDWQMCVRPARASVKMARRGFFFLTPPPHPFPLSQRQRHAAAQVLPRAAEQHL